MPAGKDVGIVTDHGWLLLPGGLPRADLPHFLAESRWERCAVMKPGARTDLPTFPWYWNASTRVAMPPGIHVFFNGLEYNHGGISLQECVVPEFTVQRTGGGAVRSRITDVSDTPARRPRCSAPANKAGASSVQTGSD